MESFSPEEFRKALAFTRASRTALSSEIQWLMDKVKENRSGLEFFEERLDSRYSRMADINAEIGQLQTYEMCQIERHHLHRDLNSSDSEDEMIDEEDS